MHITRRSLLGTAASAAALSRPGLVRAQSQTNWQGIDWLNPAANSNLRSDGGAPSWYRSDRMGALRTQWLAAPTLAEQQRVCRDIQALSFEEIPYYPIGQYKQPTAFRSTVTGIMDGTAVFWNVRPA